MIKKIEKKETYLEDVIGDISYSNINSNWLNQIDKEKCGKKDLFKFQSEAIENVVKVLYLYYENYYTNSFNKDESNKILYDLCINKGMKSSICDISSKIKKDSERFRIFSQYYTPNNNKGIIESFHFFNRLCLWMATGSGKTVLLVKMIEILDKLMSNGLIPQKDIMILFLTDKISSQFEQEVNEYNKSFPDKQIKVYSLKNDYAYNKYYLPFIQEKEISVYTYRSDLFSEKDSKKRISLETYDNNGEWYIFVDEAHKGEKDVSKRKDVVTLLSRNGFLFKFSATFTDDIDYATTCKNYNLERFISGGYGKNVYLSASTFNIKSDKESDLTNNEKQKQVLKSLIIFTLVKLEKKSTTLYHNPLMVTYVNSINKNNSDSDLDLFFEELQKIISNDINSQIFNDAKDELLNELTQATNFQFGKEKFNFKYQNNLISLTIQDILDQCFNASTHGQLEILQGKDKESEFALQVSTSNKPFALFRIAGASSYVNKKLSHLFSKNSAITQNYFNILNSQQGDCFNILIGSRMFYEGWDSNRPNVINYINLGTNEESEKLLLQSLGRGVRIYPNKPGLSKHDVRKRLQYNDIDKKSLLETLFIFATNRNAINNILKTIELQKTITDIADIEERSLELNTQSNTFDLLIPTYKDGTNIGGVNFRIAQQSFDMLKSYIDLISDNVLCLIYRANPNIISKLRCELSKPLGSNQKNFFFKDANEVYKNNMYRLLELVIAQLNTKDRQVDKIKPLEDEIIHFKHIKIDKRQWDQREITSLDNFINSVNNPLISPYELASKLLRGEITEKEFNSVQSDSSSKTIKDMDLYKLLPHYYVPIILSKKGKLDYIKHIIDEPSEVDFVKNLIEYNDQKPKIDYEWMFSKIDQTIDDEAIAMPYFNQKLNCYSNFFPDFIFWKKKCNDYIIVFVDPKGTAYTDYLLKVDAFERMFMDNNGKYKVFHDKKNKYNVTFRLKLIYDSTKLEVIPERYKKYWESNNNFDWLNNF